MTDEIWFKRTLRDLVEKHFCTASPDWIDSHAASRHMRAVMEDKQMYEVRLLSVWWDTVHTHPLCVNVDYILRLLNIL